MTKARRQQNVLGCVSISLVGMCILLPWLVGSCSETVQSQPAVAQQIQSGQAAPAVSGFFGKDLALLQPGQQGQAALVYVSPNVQWRSYDKVLLEPVEFWANPSSNVSLTDQQTLTSYFYNVLKADLQKHFTMVEQPGPNTIKITAALTDAAAATPGLRSISVVVPQARLLNGIQSLATGSYAFVGSAEGEMRITDSLTGRFLAGAIDKRAGGIALTNAAQWQWGDAQSALNYWAQKTTNRLLELQGRAAPTQSQ